MWKRAGIIVLKKPIIEPRIKLNVKNQIRELNQKSKDKTNDDT